MDLLPLHSWSWSFFQSLYGASESTASYVVGIVYDICILSPFLAYFLDKYGYRDYWISGSAIVMLLGFIIFFIPSCPVWVLAVIIGLSYAIFPPTIYSSVSLMVPKTSVGVANGVLKFFQYAGVGLLTLISGAVLDNGEDNQRWRNFNIVLMIVALLSVFVAALINWLNKRSRYPLTPSQDERKAELEVEEITPVNVAFGSRKGSHQSIHKVKDPLQYGSQSEVG